MKPQDIMFFIATGVLAAVHRLRLWVWAGMALLVFAIPLFAFRVFFTAQRFTWYAAAFFMIAVVTESVRLRNKGGWS